MSTTSDAAEANAALQSKPPKVEHDLATTMTGATQRDQAIASLAISADLTLGELLEAQRDGNRIAAFHAVGFGLFVVVLGIALLARAC